MTHHRMAAPSRAGIQFGNLTAGLAPDALVMTADGAIPAAYLEVGERVVTRRGMRCVQAMIRRPWPRKTRGILVLKDALGGKPERAVFLPHRQRVLVRDWRAQAIWGRDAATPELADLVDGAFIRWSDTRPAELIQVFLGQPELLYVEGLQLASSDPVTTSPS